MRHGDATSPDIAERKRDEIALKDTLLEAIRFRQAAENVSAYIYMKDLQSRYIYANKPTLELFGCSAEELVGCDDTRFFPPEAVNRLREVDLRVFAGEHTNEEIDVVDAGAGRRVYLEVKTPIYTDIEGKKICGLLGISTDITERKRAEEELRKLTRVVEESPAVVIITDIKGDIEYVNSQFMRLTGYTLEEVKGKNPRVLKSGYTSQEEYKQLWDTILSGKEWRGEFRNKKKNGDLYWESAIISPLFNSNGKITNFMALKEDITERKRAEEALQESEENFKAIFDKAAVGIAITEPGGHIFDCNTVYQEMTGYTKEELREMRFIDFTHPDDVARNMELQRQLADGQIEKYQLEKRYVRKNGQNIWVRITASAIRNPDGSLKNNLAIVEDISRRRQAEEEVKNAKSQAELYLDLMGHDINNMHQIALGYLEIVEGMTPRDDSRREFLEKPIEVLQRCAQLIKNVRKLQRLNEGVSQSKEVDVCKMLVDIQREFGAIPHKAITLNMNGCEYCHVRANELLHDVFANLVSNAIKHTGDGADIVIDMSVVEDSGRYCRVSVEDNGPGVADDFKGVIFNRILKGTSKAKGMGLGLYLVKSLVESYGGKVWVEDRVSGDHTKGARFVVLLTGANP